MLAFAAGMKNWGLAAYMEFILRQSERAFVAIKSLVGKLGRLLSRIEVAIVISCLALLVSLGQLYFGSFYRTAALSALVTKFEIRLSNILELGGDVQFTLHARITAAFVNPGNSPSAILKIYFTVPHPAQDCSTIEKLDWRFYSKSNLFGLTEQSHAFSVEASTVAPGAIVILDGALTIPDAVRRKALLGQDRLICLQFIALDHKGHAYVSVVPVAQLSVHSINDYGYSPIETLKDPINLLRRL